MFIYVDKNVARIITAKGVTEDTRKAFGRLSLESKKILSYKHKMHKKIKWIFMLASTVFIIFFYYAIISEMIEMAESMMLFLYVILFFVMIITTLGMYGYAAVLTNTFTILRVEKMFSEKQLNEFEEELRWNGLAEQKSHRTVR